MGKSLFIAEKPSVAKEFAKALGETFKSGDGVLESDSFVVTWCVGHLIAMSYPEKYNPALKKWSLSTLPFIPKEYKYEVISGVKKQFAIVKKQLTRPDVETIYVCTDSGREGEYIYRLVRNQAGVTGKAERRVWIDSQTEEEILKGIKNAADLSAYDNLSDSAYLRAKEDYLMGINFSRAMSLVYGNSIASAAGERYIPIAMGRVMTCVLGMVVKREREIREFVPTPFFKVNVSTDTGISAEWRVSSGSMFLGSERIFKDSGFLDREDAKRLCKCMLGTNRKVPAGSEGEDLSAEATVTKAERKKEKKNAPLLYNLAELQNECAKLFKISPEDTLKIAQELYEKKLTTYPRTDARVLSSAVCKEITKNIKGLKDFSIVSEFALEVLETKKYNDIEKSRYCDDKKITDHYAIIPTGYGIRGVQGLSPVSAKVYELICRRFLSIFYPPAVYDKVNVTFSAEVKNEEGDTFTEEFAAGFKALSDEGYLSVAKSSFDKTEKKEQALPEAAGKIRKGDKVTLSGIEIKESETSPPKRYNSGSMILAMENAGQLIEDEELRAQIKGSGIGTSATRAGILEKLDKNKYIKVNKKTQILTPTFLGEMIYDATRLSLSSLLSPELTASWEKGLTMVAEGEITAEEYMEKLEGFVRRRTQGVIANNNRNALAGMIAGLRKVYEG